MKLKAKFVLAFFISFILLTLIALAQTQEKGEILGTVVDEEGAILPGATVTLRGRNCFKNPSRWRLTCVAPFAS